MDVDLQQFHNDGHIERVRESRTMQPMIASKKRTGELHFLAPEDRRLLSRTFDIDDPTILEGLVSQPPNDDVPEIEFTYDMTPLGGRRGGHAPHLECVFRHSARHWRGYVVRWKSGERARVGGTCGAEHFGFEFNAVEQRFERARSRKGDLLKFIELRALLPGVVAELRALPQHPSIVTYDACREELRTKFPELHHALGMIARLDGQLTTTRQERDHDAEHDRAQRSRTGRKLFQDLEDAPRKGQGVVKACNHRIKKWLSSLPPIMKTVVHETGPLIGGAVLTDPWLLMHVASTGAATMARVTDEVMSNRSDHWGGTYPFSATFRDIRAAIDKVDQTVKLLREFGRFTASANLSRIAVWTDYERETVRPRIPHRIIARGQQLICEATDTILVLPQGLAIPALGKLEKLRALT